MRTPARRWAVPATVWEVDMTTLRQQMTDDLARRLLSIAGVAEAVVVADDGIAYLKVDRKRLDQEALRAFSATRA